jgi:hypothetical protein
MSEDIWHPDNESLVESEVIRNGICSNISIRMQII